MKLSQYDFNLPEELIALEPTHYRDESRLMVLHKNTGEIEHKQFKDIKDYFVEKDVIIFNDTKVFPARIYGNKEKTGATIEVFLLRELNKEQKLWDVLVDPARKIRIGNKLYFGENDELVAEVIDNTTSRGRTIRFLYDTDYNSFKNTLYKLGQTPIPSYLLEKRGLMDEDKDRYQTIYAKNEGAVAAPTAGLHFSRELLKRLEIIGVEFGYITLHAGLGNFRNIDVEDLTKHKMDSEQIFVSQEVANLINKAKQEKRKIFAVGTTVYRTLESVVTTSGIVKPFEGWTNKFLFPPYETIVPDALISNFHLPKSSMMIFVAAFCGYNEIMRAYDIAIKEKYRFGTYGDAMLII